MSDTLKKPFKLTGWHFLAMMLSFFGIIIIVNMVLLTNAISNFSGLVVDSSYVASRDFNAKIAQARKQKLLGWQLDLLVNKQGVNFILLDKDNKPISKKLVTLDLRHTQNTKSDINLLLNETSTGTYTASFPAATPPNGTWLITLNVLQQDELLYYYEEARKINFDE